jgi:hypothetical protein
MVKREVPAKTAVASPNKTGAEGWPLLIESPPIQGKSSRINEYAGIHATAAPITKRVTQSN